jgi:hypothetical protein
MKTSDDVQIAADRADAISINHDWQPLHQPPDSMLVATCLK